MCSKPKCVRVNFNSIKEDRTLFWKIRDLAIMSYYDCSNDGCGRPRIKHTDYFYHSKGCVEIKYQEDKNTAIQSKTFLADPTNIDPITVHCFCNKC